MFDPKLLKEGDNILFHTGGFSPMSVAIRILTESYWNHAGKYVEESDKGYVIEALGSGVVKTSLDKYLNNKNYRLKAIRLKEEAFKDKNEYDYGIMIGVGRMYDKIGKKYDKLGVIWLGVKLIAKGYWKKGNQYLPVKFNPFQSREKFFCSEAICESDFEISSLYTYLYQGVTGQLCDTTTPKDIGKSKWVMFVTGEDKL